MSRRFCVLICGFVGLAFLGFDALGQSSRQVPSWAAAKDRAHHEFESDRAISYPVLVRGNRARKEIALTFDDGPHTFYTRRLLDILKHERVPATFFVVGKMVDRNPDLVRQEIEEGHEVANHTYDHLRLSGLPPATIESEIREGALAIARATGASTRLFRPPGGEYDNEVINVAKRLGCVMVLWTDDPGDFARPGASSIEERTLRFVSNGGILLLHDGIQQTLDILSDLIGRLKRLGYRFVTVSEMAREGGVVKTGGPRVVARGAHTS